MKRFVFSLASLALVLLSSTAYAQDEFRQVVESKLYRQMADLGNRGYEITYGPYTDRLNQGDQTSLTLNLDGHRDYAISAVCDQDCSDLDLYVYDENGDLIASDVEPNGYPHVLVSPKWTVQFTAVITMESCRFQPCYYGVGVFGD